MSLRFSEIDLATSGAKDFVIRRRTPTFTQLMLILVAALFCITTMVMTMGEKHTLLLVLLSFVALLGWYVILLVQRSRDAMLATEFQNSLFTSALGLNNMFCLISRQDGNIIYIDRSFQEMFPDFLALPSHTMDTLMSIGRVHKEERDRIFSAIGSGIFEKIVFDIRDSKGRMHKMVMTIEPILRPSGFALLRGREFVERTEKGEQVSGSAPLSPGRSTITLFSHVIDAMEMGVYMLGPDGNIIYINPVLEQWLGYAEGEYGTKTVHVSDFATGSDERPLSVADFQGTASLRRKTGSIFRTFVNQKLIYDTQKKIIGCTALVHRQDDDTLAVKKQQW